MNDKTLIPKSPYILKVYGLRFVWCLRVYHCLCHQLDQIITK